MNPYKTEVTCDVCGGWAVCDIRHAWKAWDANYVIRHEDPGVCIANLKRKEEQRNEK